MLIVNKFIGFIRLKKYVNKANMACKYITCNGYGQCKVYNLFVCIIFSFLPRESKYVNRFWLNLYPMKCCIAVF